MKPLIVASNMLNEIDQAEKWYNNMSQISDGIVVVDGGSTDGTIEFFKKKSNVIVVIDDIIQREGYGPARNHLRKCCKEYYKGAYWCLYLDADERIHPEDYHQLRFLKEYLVDTFDVVALPRMNMLNAVTNDTKNDLSINPDWQARMTRLNSPLSYYRKLHEQLQNQNAIYAMLTNPKIRHYHRSTNTDKRDFIGRLCAKLHSEDSDYGDTYPKHHKEEHYYKQYIERGL